MPKHHSEDYKITAVKHYINKSKNLSKTCKIFECSRISLKYPELKREVEKAISKIKPMNYKNYFQYAYQKETYQKYNKKKFILRKKPKNYKLDK